MYLIITLIVGIIGGTLFYKLKFPAGAMVGAMLFCAIFNIITSKSYLPLETRIFTQIVAGAFIGHTITKKDVLSLKKVILPAFFMILLMLTLDLGMGYLMYKFTNIDLATSLMSSAPGGMMDISILASDVGADSSKVALLQLMRLMTVMSCFPLLIKFISTKVNDKKKSKATVSYEEEVSNINKNQVNNINETKKDVDTNVTNKEIIWYKDKESLNKLGLTFTVAIILGLVGYISKIPAGAMTFSMFACAILNIFTGKGYMPLIIRRFTQILAGILIGSKMTYQDIIALKAVILPAFVLLTGIIVINLIVGYAMYKVTKIDLITSLISATPGGLSDMVLISKDLGADQNTVAILQLFRYVFVIAIFPLVIKNLLIFVN